MPCTCWKISTVTMATVSNSTTGDYEVLLRPIGGARCKDDTDEMALEDLEQKLIQRMKTAGMRPEREGPLLDGLLVN